jgi:hypothetical protein
VAGPLAACDLDRWRALLERTVADDLTRSVEELLHAAGEPCRVAVADGVGEEVAVLDGAPIGLARCWVVVDRGSLLWRAAIARCGPRREAAALLLVEAVVQRLGLSAATRSRVLDVPAAIAVARAAEA